MLEAEWWQVCREVWVWGPRRMSQLLGICYRTFPVKCWFRSLPSAQQACRSFFRVIHVGGPLKGPQLTTTADTLALVIQPAFFSVIY